MMKLQGLSILIGLQESLTNSYPAMLKVPRLLALLFTGALVLSVIGCDTGDPDDGDENAAATYAVALAGANEVPPVATDASGEATIEVNSAGMEVEYNLTVSDIDRVVGAHIHTGSPDENGPVVVTLFSGDTTGVIAGDTTLAEGTATVADSLVQAMAAGNAYVNVHTVANPAGEIRGQIGPAVE